MLRENYGINKGDRRDLIVGHLQVIIRAPDQIRGVSSAPRTAINAHACRRTSQLVNRARQ
jgi:hypothetical protein